MAFPSTTNVDGSNPGPNVSTQPDTTQAATGNIWKQGLFLLTITPALVAANTTVEQSFANTGIGLVVGDFIEVNKPSAQAGLGVVNTRVSAADTLAITFVNATGSGITPTAETYQVYVVRPQPNWVKPASGNQMDW
jgi:hypothetical protein